MELVMQMHRDDYSARGILHALLLAAGVWAIAALIHLSGVLSALDLKLLDLSYRARGERGASPDIAIVEIDEETIAAYGHKWPLPRNTYALLIDALEEAGARAIAFDLLFIDANTENPQYDQLLASVTAAHPNVVHAIGFPPPRSSAAEANHLPEEIRGLLRARSLAVGHVDAAEWSSVSLPFADLLRAAREVGHVTVSVDRADGVHRRVPMLVAYHDRLYPSLALETVMVAEAGDRSPQIEPHPGGFNLRWAEGRRLMVPMDGEGGTPIYWAGDRKAFPNTHSMLEVLRWSRGREADRLADVFRGRIVLVGSTAIGEAAADAGATPFKAFTPLLFVHANAVNAILQGHFLRSVPTSWFLGCLAVVGLLLGWGFYRLSLPLAAVAAVLALLVLLAAQYMAFVHRRIAAPMSLGLIVPAGTYVAIASYRLVFMERRARHRAAELAVARGIQARLLPSSPPNLPDMDIFGVNLPAQEVGGDYYDWCSAGDGALVVVVGDVSGKGISAALLMSHLQASCHAEIREGRTPSAVVDAMNKSLFRATAPQHFATFFMAEIIPARNELVFCNAGHNPGLLSRAGQTESLEPTGTPLGIMEEAEYSDGTHAFSAGDVLVLYSDGITEAARHGELYGEERLRQLVAALTSGPAAAQEIGRRILDDVRAFARDPAYADDITLVVVRRR
jgi:serine phosphatase RsbU (regulator of sigma subunit)